MSPLTEKTEVQPAPIRRNSNGDQVMHASRLINIVDSLALTVMNAIVFVGLPMAAVGLFIR
jgi:hypothetical protein